MVLPMRSVDVRHELIQILRDARSLLALPDNDFSWSSWEDATAALSELDGYIAALERGDLPSHPDLAVLFAPTGRMQDVSISSGWGYSFLAVAERFDRVAARI